MSFDAIRENKILAKISESTVSPCFAMQYLVSFVILQSLHRGRDNWLLYFNCVILSCGCYCSVSLAHGAMGGSVVCDCEMFSINCVQKISNYFSLFE